MDDTKREELEKACKKEKDHKVRTRIVAVRMVRVLNMSVDETASILVHCPTWVRDWLRSYDEGGLEGLRDLPRCGRPRRITRDAISIRIYQQAHRKHEYEFLFNVIICRLLAQNPRTISETQKYHTVLHASAGKADGDHMLLQGPSQPSLALHSNH